MENEDGFVISVPSVGKASTPKQSGDEKETQSTGRWTEAEHALFEQGLRVHGKDWYAIASLIPTRTVIQIRTHAQKYLAKVAKVAAAAALPSPSFGSEGAPGGGGAGSAGERGLLEEGGEGEGGCAPLLLSSPPPSPTRALEVVVGGGGAHPPGAGGGGGGGGHGVWGAGLSFTAPPTLPWRPLVPVPLTPSLAPHDGGGGGWGDAGLDLGLGLSERLEFDSYKPREGAYGEGGVLGGGGAWGSAPPPKKRAPASDSWAALGGVGVLGEEEGGSSQDGRFARGPSFEAGAQALAFAGSGMLLSPARGSPTLGPAAPPSPALPSWGGGGERGTPTRPAPISMRHVAAGAGSSPALAARRAGRDADSPSSGRKRAASGAIIEPSGGGSTPEVRGREGGAGLPLLTLSGGGYGLAAGGEERRRAERSGRASPSSIGGASESTSSYASYTGGARLGGGGGGGSDSGAPSGAATGGDRTPVAAGEY